MLIFNLPNPASNPPQGVFDGYYTIIGQNKQNWIQSKITPRNDNGESENKYNTESQVIPL